MNKIVSEGPGCRRQLSLGPPQHLFLLTLILILFVYLFIYLWLISAPGVQVGLAGPQARSPHVTSACPISSRHLLIYSDWLKGRYVNQVGPRLSLE